MTPIEVFMAEMKDRNIDPWDIVEALLIACDPDEILDVDDLYEVLEEGRFSWPAQDSELKI